LSGNKLTSTIKYLLFLGVGILLMYLAFRGMDFSKMLNDLKHADYSWVLLSLFISVFAFLSRAYRWILLIEPLGYKPKLSNTFYSLMVGYFANLAIPRIGEITRCTALYEVEKTPINSSFGTVVAERVVDLICLFITLLITLFWKFSEISAFFSTNVIEPLSNKIASLPLPYMVAVLAVAVLGLLLVYIFRKKIAKVGFIIKMKSLLAGVAEGLKTVFRLKRKAAFLFHTFAIWFLYFVMTYICFFAIEPTSNLSPMVGVFILVAGGFGMSAPVQGGFGAYHIIVSSALTITAITGAAITQAEGLLFATIIHTSQTIFILILGCASLVMLNIAKRKLIKNEQA